MAVQLNQGRLVVPVLLGKGIGPSLTPFKTGRTPVKTPYVLPEDPQEQSAEL